LARHGDLDTREPTISLPQHSGVDTPVRFGGRNIRIKVVPPIKLAQFKKTNWEKPSGFSLNVCLEYRTISWR